MVFQQTEKKEDPPRVGYEVFCQHCRHQLKVTFAGYTIKGQIKTVLEIEPDGCPKPEVPDSQLMKKLERELPRLIRGERVEDPKDDNGKYWDLLEKTLGDQYLAPSPLSTAPPLKIPLRAYMADIKKNYQYLMTKTKSPLEGMSEPWPGSANFVHMGPVTCECYMCGEQISVWAWECPHCHHRFTSDDECHDCIMEDCPERGHADPDGCRCWNCDLPWKDVDSEGCVSCQDHLTETTKAYFERKKIKAEKEITELKVIK